MKYQSINQTDLILKSIVIGLIAFTLTACKEKRTRVPFCSFEQLSNGVSTKVDNELLVSPVLLKTDYWDLPQKDTFLSFKTWRINDQYKVEHKAPTYSLRLFKEDVSDTFIVNNQKFDVNKIVGKPIVAIIKSISHYRQNGDSYLILKVVNGGSGRILFCNLLVFNITDSNNVVCLNETSGISGETWMVKENLITDLDKNRILELNLVDSLKIRSYHLLKDALIRSDRYLSFKQTGDLQYCIDIKDANWYFDIRSSMYKDSCNFNFDEDLPGLSYDK
ncbi:hypothetical protein [Chitinophaga nivalis]|uniref:Lipoprotein n=1 Tax=Chitinophaga nivalis TaxID=2991709 RepID=A0ABT3IRR4_9BACT|nr:hypothetical protein [Chitinophaga nivalis]MCW3463675.1 hypothetical protein [Chitinophaga nivalis]MCW3486635.1 hypothetical protein [Chitinophaga nivalis]